MYGDSYRLGSRKAIWIRPRKHIVSEWNAKAQRVEHIENSDYMASHWLTLSE